MIFEWWQERLRRVLRPSSRDLALCLQETGTAKMLFLSIAVVPIPSPTPALGRSVLGLCDGRMSFHMTALWSHEGEKRDVLLFCFKRKIIILHSGFGP